MASRRLLILLLAPVALVAGCGEELTPPSAATAHRSATRASARPAAQKVPLQVRSSAGRRVQVKVLRRRGRRCLDATFVLKAGGGPGGSACEEAETRDFTMVAGFAVICPRDLVLYGFLRSPVVRVQARMRDGSVRAARPLRIPGRAGRQRGFVLALDARSTIASIDGLDVRGRAIRSLSSGSGAELCGQQSGFSFGTLDDFPEP